MPLAAADLATGLALHRGIALDTSELRCFRGAGSGGCFDEFGFDVATLA
jgi:hypothetical protein